MLTRNDLQGDGQDKLVFLRCFQDPATIRMQKAIKKEQAFPSATLNTHLMCL